MYENLQDRFQGIFRNLRSEGRITEEHLSRAMREIRMDASHDSSTSSWAHPAYWAPFVLIGGR